VVELSDAPTGRVAADTPPSSPPAGWMKGAGLGDAPRTLLYEFAKIKSGDIVLPAESAAGIRTAVRLRHVTEPEAEQKTLLHRLGLTLPRRLKRLDSPAQM